MTVIAMSRTEIDRMHMLRDLAAGRIPVNEAAQLTRLTRRHVFGWPRRIGSEGHQRWSRHAAASRATAAIRRRSELRRWD